MRLQMTLELHAQDLIRCNWEYADIRFVRYDRERRRLDVSWSCPMSAASGSLGRELMGAMLGRMTVYTLTARFEGVREVGATAGDEVEPQSGAPWLTGDCKDLEIQQLSIIDNELRLIVEHHEMRATFESVRVTRDEGAEQKVR
jgi:hypothetical protein